jgi:hypothetical protein
LFALLILVELLPITEMLRYNIFWKTFFFNIVPCDCNKLFSVL